MDASWVTIAISILSTMFFVGVCYQALKSKTETNAAQIRDLKGLTMSHVEAIKESFREDLDEVKSTRATTEKVENVIDRINRLEGGLKTDFQEKWQDLKEMIRDLNVKMENIDARFHNRETTNASRRIEE